MKVILLDCIGSIISLISRFIVCWPKYSIILIKIITISRVCIIFRLFIYFSIDVIIEVEKMVETHLTCFSLNYADDGWHKRNGMWFGSKNVKDNPLFITEARVERCAKLKGFSSLEMIDIKRLENCIGLSNAIC